MLIDVILFLIKLYLFDKNAFIFSRIEICYLKYILCIIDKKIKEGQRDKQ